MLLSRDCVAYTSLIKSPYGSKLPTAFFSNLCTYFSNANFLVAMRLWETPVPSPNTTVKTQAADGTALETVSYTHLDVYKRQPRYTVRARVSWLNLQSVKQKISMKIKQVQSISYLQC